MEVMTVKNVCSHNPTSHNDNCIYTAADFIPYDYYLGIPPSQLPIHHLFFKFNFLPALMVLMIRICF